MSLKIKFPEIFLVKCQFYCTFKLLTALHKYEIGPLKPKFTDTCDLGMKFLYGFFS